MIFKTKPSFTYFDDRTTLKIIRVLSIGTQTMSNTV
jgi:hypothetical protein